MRENQLCVRMLGTFSIDWNGKRIDDSNNRAKKVWLLLAYMIYYRSRSVTQEELTGLLWGDDEESSNPVNALKTMLHRGRTMLNQLGESAGHDLIVRRKGSYAWNVDMPIWLDVEEFERLCGEGAGASGEERLEKYLQALDLYQGDFLNKLSTEPWVIPIAAYFHNRYVHAVEEVLPVLEEKSRLTEAVDLCRRAISVEPYHEGLYQHLMRNLLDLGDSRGAVRVYEDMNELFFAQFSVMPAEETRALYREAIRTVNDRAVPIGVVREQLRENAPPPGALICEYDFFKLLYHAEARFITRTGDAIHIALLSMTAEDGGELSKRSLDRAMDNLQEQVQMNLRRGDVAARCSVSQFIILLPQANYENSCMVCERIIKSFCRQYPHSPAKLHYSVQPMDPTT